MRTVDVCVQCRKTVRKTLGDEALSGEMVTLVELVPAENVKDGGIALKRRRVQRQLVEQMRNSGEAPGRIFEGDPAHQTMHFVAQAKQIFGEVASVLAGNAGDQCLLHEEKSRYRRSR